jgi:toxin ParE1/3/4
VKPVIIHSEAESELEAGVAFYESRREGLGLAFHEEFEAIIWLVRSDPLRWSPYRDGRFRRCLFKRFPYSLFYLDLDEVIWIAALAHQKRRPEYWVDRMPE